MIDTYIDMALWGEDHWSTLAYLETVMVDCAGFQVGADSKMRSNRRNFRVMLEGCPAPKRTTRGKGLAAAVTIWPEHGTRLSNGTVVPNHDDWMCVQDMAAANLFTVDELGVQPGAILHLSKLGKEVAQRLREHKANGGTFGNFVYEQDPQATVQTA